MVQWLPKLLGVHNGFDFIYIYPTMPTNSSTYYVPGALNWSPTLHQSLLVILSKPYV
jgi:hypothetical protein